MPAYQHIFFDLDHTLWDFERCSCETLEELFQTYNLHTYQLGVEKFIYTFRITNRKLWDLYSAGKITQKELRTTRFVKILKELGIIDTQLPSQLAEDYLRLCPQKPHLLPYAREVLEYLKDKYVLHIITNGFADIQFVKLKSANITSYFTQVITSEIAGCKKPDRKIFDYAFEQTKSEPRYCLMIGDSLDADMQGARNVQLDHVFFNYENITHKQKPTHEIKCLSELMQLL